MLPSSFTAAGYSKGWNVGTFVLQGKRLPEQNIFKIENRSNAVSRRISRCAAGAPERIAVADGTAQLTYRELERRSDYLAARLQEAGAAPNRCVGVYVERSADFIVAALAVLKSGAAYVPLDLSTPPERAAFILEDAGAFALITQPGTPSPASGRRHVIEMDDWSATSRSAFAKVELDAANLAYVIYTSGSTGKPKGVEITHGNLSNLVNWHQSEFRVTSSDRASQVAGLGFDASVWEIWPYLTAGASVCVADELTRRSPEALRDWMVAEKITIGFVPTIVAEQLLHIDWPDETSLSILLTGGDTLHARPAPKSPFRVVNNYGPTECTVVATSGAVSSHGDDGAPPSIGRPIANATALILDEALRPVAAGEVGELCIGGALVGRGYRNLPELTASRFVDYLSASADPLRIYRTGDRARLLQNGEIEFLGRLDDQVKIRGHRIELGEIAAHLDRCPGIEWSAVSVKDLGARGLSLVAYIVLVDKATLAAAGVRQFLATYLPDYMVPEFFVVMSELPVTASGKLDRSALPEPCVDNLLPYDLAADGTANAGGSELQCQIAALVATLLRRPAIDVDENFFMIGGHSMLGVQLIAQIRDKFGVKVTLRQLFTAPTIAALSQEVARLKQPA